MITMDLKERQKKVIDKLTKLRENKMKDAADRGPAFGKLDKAIELTKNQPQSIRKTLDYCQENMNIDEFINKNINRVIAVGCGDSYFSCMAIRMAVQDVANIDFFPFQALEYSRYYNNLTTKRSSVFAVSSSGTVPRTVEAMFVGKNAGALTVAVTNSLKSALAEQSQNVISVQAKREGPPTQSSSAAMIAMITFFIKYARRKEKKDDANKIWNEMQEIPQKIAKTISKLDSQIKELAKTLVEKNIFHFIGGGPSLGTAHFGYAKVREATWREAIPWQLEEWDHEQTGQIPKGLPVFLIAPNGSSYDRAQEIAQVLDRDNAYLISLVEEGEENISSVSKVCLEIPTTIECLSPFTFSVPLQLFSLYLAKAIENQ